MPYRVRPALYSSHVQISVHAQRHTSKVSVGDKHLVPAARRRHDETIVLGETRREIRTGDAGRELAVAVDRGRVRWVRRLVGIDDGE